MLYSKDYFLIAVAVPMIQSFTLLVSLKEFKVSPKLSVSGEILGNISVSLFPPKQHACMRYVGLESLYGMKLLVCQGSDDNARVGEGAVIIYK